MIPQIARVAACGGSILHTGMVFQIGPEALVIGPRQVLKNIFEAFAARWCGHCNSYALAGGSDGEWIIDLLQALRVPVVTTCHTLLQKPSAGQRQVLQHVARESAHLVVMAQKGRELLGDVLELPDEKISLIPHGIPDTESSPEKRNGLRQTLGWNGRSVLLTFGLLSPNKGIEQPLEVQAMVAGCLEAERATGDPSWLAAARRFHNWFHGANDIGITIADAATGGCHDGLQKIMCQIVTGNA